MYLFSTRRCIALLPIRSFSTDPPSLALFDSPTKTHLLTACEHRPPCSTYGHPPPPLESRHCLIFCHGRQQRLRCLIYCSAKRLPSSKSFGPRALLRFARVQSCDVNSTLRTLPISFLHSTFSPRPGGEAGTVSLPWSQSEAPD